MKDTAFYKNNTINCKGKLISLDKPIVVGILNVTPDSFYDGDKFKNKTDILNHVQKMLEEGATIIDIGGYSSRPNATHISEKEEITRLIPTIQLIHKKFPETIISADTFRSNVAKQAIESGVCIINDISGGTMDKKMFTTIGKLQVPYILTHIQNTPQTMQRQPSYINPLEEIIIYFSRKICDLKQKGVTDIIIDPGFGFGKTLKHNYEILNNIKLFQIFNYCIMAGISRKSMINKVLNTIPETALNGSTIANTIALLNGATFIRTHDVLETIEAIKVVDKLKTED